MPHYLTTRQVHARQSRTVGQRWPIREFRHRLYRRRQAGAVSAGTWYTLDQSPAKRYATHTRLSLLRALFTCRCSSFVVHLCAQAAAECSQLPAVLSWLRRSGFIREGFQNQCSYVTTGQVWPYANERSQHLLTTLANRVVSRLPALQTYSLQKMYVCIDCELTGTNGLGCCEVLARAACVAKPLAARAQSAQNAPSALLSSRAASVSVTAATTPTSGAAKQRSTVIAAIALFMAPRSSDELCSKAVRRFVSNASARAPIPVRCRAARCRPRWRQQYDCHGNDRGSCTRGAGHSDLPLTDCQATKYAQGGLSHPCRSLPEVSNRLAALARSRNCRFALA